MLMAKEIFYDRYIFAASLKRLMYRNNERQIDIANLLSVSRATVSAYCSGSQMPRMDKIERLAHHFGVSRAELIEGVAMPEKPILASPARSPEPVPQLDILYEALNDAGKDELLRYGQYLGSLDEYRAEKSGIEYIKHFLIPAAAGYASPIEGDDYELIRRTDDMPAGADFCISIDGDSMEPYILDGDTVFVRRGVELSEFEVGIFFIDGDVFCKQWSMDSSGTLHLLSANPLRQDANISIPKSSNRGCVCFGKVLLPKRLPKPIYYAD